MVDIGGAPKGVSELVQCETSGTVVSTCIVLLYKTKRYWGLSLGELNAKPLIYTPLIIRVSDSTKLYSLYLIAAITISPDYWLSAVFVYQP